MSMKYAKLSVEVFAAGLPWIMLYFAYSLAHRANCAWPAKSFPSCIEGSYDVALQSMVFVGLLTMILGCLLVVLVWQQAVQRMRMLLMLSLSVWVFFFAWYGVGFLRMFEVD